MVQRSWQTWQAGYWTVAACRQAGSWGCDRILPCSPWSITSLPRHWNTHWIDHSHNTSLENSLQCNKLWSVHLQKLKFNNPLWKILLYLQNWHFPQRGALTIWPVPAHEVVVFLLLLANIAVCHLLIWWGTRSCLRVVVTCSTILATRSQSLDTYNDTLYQWNTHSW